MTIIFTIEWIRVYPAGRVCVQQIRVQCRMIGSGRHKNAIGFVVFTQYKQLFGIARLPRPLAHGPVVKSVVATNHLARIDIDERSGFVANVFLDELVEIAFANKANAGAFTLARNTIESGLGGYALYSVLA